MDGCIVSAELAENSKVFKAIRKKVGTNDSLYFGYYGAVVDDKTGDYSEGFKSYYKALHPKSSDISLDGNYDTRKVNSIINAIMRFYNFNTPDGNDTVINKENTDIARDYISVADRKFCQRIVASEMLDIFRIERYENHKNINHSRSWYITEATNSFGIELIKRLKSILDIKEDNELMQKLDKNKIVAAANYYLQSGEDKATAIRLAKYQNLISLYTDTLGDDITAQETNFVATFKEMINPEQDGLTGRKIKDLFFDEIFKDKRLGDIRHEVLDEFETVEEEKAQQAEEIETGEDITEDDVDDVVADFDLTFRAYNNHDGQYSTFMMHIGSDIKTYLNCLRKLSDIGKINGERNYNRNNPIGIADTMTAEECAIMLYTSVNYYNIDSMIESIDRISKTVAGFEAFAQLAEDLKNNYDFANELYTTFGKAVMGKTRTTLDGDKIKSTVTNRTANRIDALRYQLEAEALTSLISIDKGFASAELTKLKKKIDDYNKIKPISEKLKLDKAAKRKEIIEEFTKQIRRYYPSIDESAIINFINSNTVNGEVKEANNIASLINVLNNTIVSSVDTQANYQTKLSESAKARKENKSTADIWSESYIDTKSRNAIGDLANLLGKYSVIKVELNSTNVHGKKASDVINSSMITNLMDILHSELNESNDENTPIRNYAKYKFRSHQYDLSNILVEVSNGKTIEHPGLFRKQVNADGSISYEPTAYASKLIQMELFDGIKDDNTDKALLYSEMSNGDYVATAMSNFFFCDYSIDGMQTAFAKYFMRTPSDAPKNFTFTAPRYRLGDNFWTVDADGVRHINKEHPIFKQLYAAFEQEMVDAASAIDVLFYHTNGEITRTEGSEEPMLKQGIDDRRVFANYHRKNNEYVDEDGIKHKESGIVQNLWEEVSDGVYRKVGNLKRLSGNVFTSDKFTITDRTTGETRNYLNEVLDERPALTEDGKIHILYGGANTHLHINDDGSVTFTPAQQRTIEDALENFIKDYIANGIERISQFDNLLKNILDEKQDVKENQIAEFLLNYRLAYYNANDLFEGNAKFYKDAQDFLKRAKEVQGSGVPYALRDITKPMFGQDRVEVDASKSYLNSEEMQTLVAPLHNCKQFTTFRAVTIKNTIRSDKKSIEELTKQLVANFRKEGFTKHDAEAKAKQLMKAYENVKTNDAQSYITFEEWIRRVAGRGQLYKYKPLIEAILDESRPLDESVINQFIQVQKNFYYDMYYDEGLDVMAPRQIKNAEFVLVPRLIKGTQLEAVYNAMVHYGIDQLNTEETSKAGKANVLTLWDNNGNLTKEWTDDFNQNVANAMQIYDYNYLYTQQETPNHTNAENKAGIQLMKKIIDNIPEDSPLYENKKRLLANYTQNIYQSFKQIVTELGVELDENGNLKLDETDNIKGLSFEKIYKRLEEEMMRLGLDSNMLDYCTLDEVNPEENKGDNGIGARPKMPPHFSNVKSKIENIAQAIFNNRITRQKLPGFHAAQVTHIGWRNTGKESYTYSKDLHYHPNGERYVEIMLPAANFGFDINDSKYDNYREQAAKEGWDAKKLEEEIKKDMLAELKAAGLDTVIGYRIPTEGKQSVCVMKVVGFTDDALGSTIVVPDGWVAQTGSDFDIDSIYGIQFASYKTKDGIKKVEYTEDTDENYKRYVISNLTKDDRINLYKDTRLDKAEQRELAGDNPDATYLEYQNLLEQEEKQNLLEGCKYYASRNGLMSYDEFSKLSYAEQNPKDARNNQILSDMIEILQSDEALEENLSSSNFRRIIEARDKIQKGSVFEKIKKGRSTYDFLDQSDYREEAASGMKLKGASVARDNFCSVCNTVKPTLTRPIEIIYKADANKIKQLKKSFNDVENLGNGYVKVKHNTFGWSKNNRNVAGELITAYSSQTTAHILDAIKEGNIPNVNSFTFNVYKLFPDIGSDYETAVAFMMQPGVKRIVDAFNRVNSIYVNEYQRPIDLAIREIASSILRAEPKKGMSIKDIDTLIQRQEGSLIKEINDTLLNADTLTDRIHRENNQETSQYDKVFDYLVIKKYQELSFIANKIGDLARVCNPDKFGAKQSIFATSKVFRDIQKIVKDEEPIFSVNKDGNRISFLEAVYPGVSKGLSDYIKNPNNDSLYPTIHYFLKYASATSIKINKSLFLTQSDGFIDLVNKLSKSFQKFANVELTEERYNDFERYILSVIYNHVPVISNPISYNKETGFEETNGSIDLERERLFGYGYQADTKIELADGTRVEFNPKNINNPTEEEIEQFGSLTPAQKVYWIQQHFRDGLICKHLNVRLFNAASYNKQLAGSQTINFIEDGQDMDYIYEEFRKTFQNENPLLAMTAMDIIKYGFVVEGFRMRKRSVNRVIDNDILINELGKEGTGIVSMVDTILQDIATNPNVEIQVGSDTLNIDEIVENYIRSHTDMREIAHTYVNKDEFNKVILPHRNIQGILCFEPNDDTIAFLSSHNVGNEIVNERGISMGFEENPYIVISSVGRKILYKVVRGENTGTIYLCPLSKLQPNEIGEISVNPENNIGVTHTTKSYDDVITGYENTASNLNIEEFKRYSAQQVQADKNSKLDKSKSIVRFTESKPININDDSVGGISQLKQQIINHFGLDNFSTLYVESAVLNKHIFTSGVNYGLDNIYVNGRRYIIYKVDTRALYPFTANIDIKIPKRLKDVEHIIENARNRGILSGNPGKAHVNDLFAVMPYVKEHRSSSVTEHISKVTTQAARSINRTANNVQDEAADKFKNQLNRNNIDVHNKDVETNLKDVIISTAEYVTSKVDSLLNGEHGLNFFTKIPGTEEYVSITDPRIIEIIANNSQLRRNFLKTLLEAQNVIDTFSAFAKTAINDDNADLQIYIDKINTAIDKLEKSGILEQAQANYVNIYFGNITNNPNVRRDIISVMDNFHKTGYLTSYISDLQDIANPIVQIITSDVMADIRAKEFAAREEVKKYRDKIKQIKDEAAKHGLTIDFDKIIDKYGVFIGEHDEKFIEDFNAVYEAKDLAYEKYKSASSPVEEYTSYEDYLRKDLAYRKFMLEHVNQRIADDLVRSQIEMDERMLTNHKDVYVQYKLLTSKLYDILSHTVRGKLDAHWEEERKNVTREIQNLRSTIIISPLGIYQQKEDITEEELSTNPEKRREQIINSRVSAEAIDKYIKDRAALNEQIYEYDEKFGFREELDKRLQIIRSREIRNEFGKLVVPEATLLNDKEYVEAKEWLRENAIFRYNIWDITADEKEKALKPNDILISLFDEPDSVVASFNLRVQAALQFFQNSIGERGNRKAAYKLLAKRAEARDEFGVIDGTKFTDEEIAIIRKEQEAKYNIGESNPYCEKGIIHNANSDDTIYTSEFYKGLNVGGVSNPEYLAIVNGKVDRETGERTLGINDYLRRALDSSTGRLNTSELSIEEINAVLDLFSKLGYDRNEQIFNTENGVKKRKGVKRRDVQAVKDFIEKNVEFVTDNEAFEIEKSKAKLKGDRYYLAWQEMNQEWSDEKNMFIPNHLIWGYAKPKDSLSAEEKEKFIDKAKTSAVRIINEVFEERYTKYYVSKYEQMAKDYGVNSDEFKTWYANNHVYNPFTHKFEPLVCWTTSEVTSAMPGKWEANYGMKENNIKDSAKNNEYKEKAGVSRNYKKGSGYDLSSDKKLNPYEEELKNYLMDTEIELSRTKQARARAEKGYAPARAKKEDKSIAKVVLTELAHSVGWIEGHNGKERYNPDIKYAYDYAPTMPMMQQLKAKESVDIDKYEKEHKPVRTSTETDAEYNKRVKDFEEDVKKVKENNRKIHSEMLDRNWEDVFEDYILQASHYNAIQDNKYQLYYGQKLLDTYMPYETSSITGNLIERDGEYVKVADNNLRNVYDNWIRRLVFDQWKKQQGMATRAFQILQSITSTNYMTLNLRGGIANVLVGETGILGEVFAKEYFGASQWAAGKALWAEGLIDYMANAYSEKANTLSGAIVKAFNVVDFDELTAQVKNLSPEEVSKRLRDMTFITLSGGEHFMQNGALFSMTLSHRVVANPRRGEIGQTDYVIMNEAEYLRYASDEALGKIATEEEIEAYRKSIKDDPNIQKDYATYRRDFVSEYVFMNLSKDKIKAYREELDKIKERKREEFENCPTVHDQFKLGDDGTLTFKEGSIFSELNVVKEGQDISDAYKLMGQFRGRVISVNKKIHGFYDKMGAALIEREWWGSIVMQYHKHIYPGIMKRYRRKGYFNEERGTIEKGGLWSIIDFLEMPIRKIAAENKLNAGQTDALEGLQKYVKFATDYLNYATVAWEVLPDYEKANIRRIMQDLAGVTSAVFMAIAIRCAWDDDDDSIIYNLALYEADRLATETGMYGIGAYTEFKTLWSSPVAVQSIVSDIYSSVGLMTEMLMEGDDFDPYYRSGRYAGKKKLAVRLERRIPYWRNYMAIRDIAESNRAYRIGDNALSIIPVKKIANKIKGKDNNN